MKEIKNKKRKNEIVKECKKERKEGRHNAKKGERHKDKNYQRDRPIKTNWWIDWNKEQDK